MEGIDREVRVGGAMHSETPSPLSRGCALCPPAPPPVLPLTAKQGCYPGATRVLPELWHLHRAHPGSLARVPNDLARQGLSRIRHSHACHRRTSSEGARQRKQAAHTAGGRLDEECCCAALPRVAAQRLHYGTRERTCKGQQNNERLHGLVQPPRAKAPLAYNTQRKLPYLSKIRGGSVRGMGRAFSFTL